MKAKRQPARDFLQAEFPDVDPGILAHALQRPVFAAPAFRALLEVSPSDWAANVPAAHEARFESFVDAAERRAKGVHYTAEKTILRVIAPLFLDDLRDEYERLKADRRARRQAALAQFQKKLGELRFLDPACGCGDFLTISFRELHCLETDVMRERIRCEAVEGESAPMTSRVSIGQFYGIEISEVPGRIAMVALRLMDLIMSAARRRELGVRLGRRAANALPNIVRDDALEMDWADLLEPASCSFVLGNPPFVGAKRQTRRQRSQVRSIATLGATGGTLDYAAAWFIKAAAYVQHSHARIGFVATNSITQGEQVAQLWPILLEQYALDIAFAHRTFVWASAAQETAQVHVVVIGLDRRSLERSEKRLFTYSNRHGEPTERRCRAISPYLIDAGQLGNPRGVVCETAESVCGLKPMLSGSQTIDGGHYIFNAEQRAAFLRDEPGAVSLMRPFVGVAEFLSGKRRWILVPQDASPAELAQLPVVRDRIAQVRAFRHRSRRGTTRKLANYPTRWQVRTVPDAPFLTIPETNSWHRYCVPIAWLAPPAIPSNALKVLPGATLADFALLTSAMHMAWLRLVGGRYASSYRYSIRVVYNTFPAPPGFGPDMADHSILEAHAQAVLDARGAHPDSTLSRLYKSDTMPENLLRAHQALDRAVDRLYRSRSFVSMADRVAHLLGRYQRLTVQPTLFS